jgi:hypothetical protein
VGSLLLRQSLRLPRSTYAPADLVEESAEG